MINTKSIDESWIDQQTKDHTNRLLKEAAEADFACDQLRRICEHILPHHIRTDWIAQRYQQFYFRAGSWVYGLAAGAVAVAAFQALFFPERMKIILVEVFFMALVLIIIGVGTHRRWQAQWIDYRFLAERFRSALFMASARAEVTKLRPPRHLSLAYSSKDWVVTEFSRVWDTLPATTDGNHFNLEALRKFIFSAWIDEQVRYHRRTSERHSSRHHRITNVGNSLFALTFVAAVLHAFEIGPHSLHPWLTFLAIVLPAVGAALSAIRTHREYHKIAKRAAEMVHHLEEIRAAMVQAKTREPFLALMREAEETMLHENEDWRVVVRFHELETPS